MRTPPRVLTIAGSDSAGHSGVAADLRTCAAFGAHGMLALTAVTAQNGRGVHAAWPVEPEILRRQIEVVAEDPGIDVIKIGMLGDVETAGAVADAVERLPGTPIVIDPVLSASSGDALSATGTVGVLRERLLPRSILVTPNGDEAGALLGREVAGVEDRARAAREIYALGPIALVTGGDEDGDTVIDVLFDGQREHRLTGSRIVGQGSRGTGCTLATAIACGIAAGRPMLAAVRAAHEFVRTALETAYPLGAQGAVHQLHRLRGV